MYITGEFGGRDAIVRVLRDLKENGLGPDDLDVYSDTPLELPRSVLERRTHMSLAVVTGAISASLLAIGFVYFTQHNYPIITGGMPIFSFWATGVVFYELTMLGAIVTSLFWFLRESGLLRRRRRPAPLYEPGSVALRVRCDPGQEQMVRQLLETAGGSKFTTEGAAG
jgi:hypothetical protein